MRILLSNESITDLRGEVKRNLRDWLDNLL